jgi:drug/metabolite transporter (DMT)-like permease
VLLAPAMLGERLRSSDMVPLAVCLFGIAILFAGNWSESDLLGLVLGAGSGFFFGLFFIWLRRMRYADPIAITAVSCAGVAALLGFMPFVADYDAEDIALLVFMSAVQFALPYVLFTKGISRVEGTEASLIALIEPVLNPIWVALFYGEEASTATIVGGAVIIGGLALRYTVFRPPPSEVLIEPAAETAGGSVVTRPPP